MADDNQERPTLSLSGDANAAARRSDPPRRPSSKPASHERATRAEMDNVHRLIRDNQRERALDYIDELLERYTINYDALALIESGGFPLQEEPEENFERVASVSPNNGGNGPS